MISSQQITVENIKTICNLAFEIERTPKNFNSRLEGKILATLFFEPSTRTRFSFESAMQRLGGKILTLEQGASSSASKGETLADTARIMSAYADCVVIRHPQVGSAEEFAKYSQIPVINGGDGSNQHPTQALTDIFTILKEKGRIHNLKIVFVGDIKHSRTVFALAQLLSMHENNEFHFIAYNSCQISDEKLEILQKTGTKCFKSNILEEILPNTDVLYVTRTQKERFSSESEYEAVKNRYIITKKMVEQFTDLTIMHPLPRIYEILPEVDDLPQAKYFDQARNAVFVRMAILYNLLVG
jgi:aspartate carbamoyltransferase catalytic subunit